MHRVTATGLKVLRRLEEGPIEDLKVQGMSRLNIQYALGELEAQGFALSSRAGWSITATGRAFLSERLWVCRYCVTEFFGSDARRLSGLLCKSCGREHVVCKGCRKFVISVGGEFPAYRMMVRECPGPAIRMVIIMKKGARKKKGKQDDARVGGLL